MVWPERLVMGPGVVGGRIGIRPEGQAMADRFAIILAAGKGTRMKSPRPKVLHEIGGRSMLAWSVALARDLGCKRSVVVVGPDMDMVARAVEPHQCVIQKDRLGTGHAGRGTGGPPSPGQSDRCRRRRQSRDRPRQLFHCCHSMGCCAVAAQSSNTI